ncbi:MAG TPA: EAL domain-containing protein [Methylophilaceae bacterium]|jgi:diguanylate cyclase (GGDEF)-like protein
MVGSYDYSLVLLSLLIAFISSWAGLSFAAKLHGNHDRASKLWLLASALTVGTGIWSMHFIGMLSFSLPIPVSYAFDLTILSWLIAVVISWMGFRIAHQTVLSSRLIVVGGLVLATGICSMHYMGMAAMRMMPPINYDSWLFFLSFLIPAIASMAALRILYWQRTLSGKHALVGKLITALLMSAGIAGMHYTGMAAAEFASGSICGVSNAINPTLLAIVSATGVICLVLGTFVIALLDARMESLNTSHSLSLQDENLELNRIAMMDTLTHLPNRRLFQQHLEVAVGRISRGNNSLAVAFIDLDEFKPVNDVLGHHVGDEVLLAVAKRLMTAVRGCDVVARLGGDEFVALIEDIRSDEDIVPVIERIIQSLRDVFYIDHHEVRISASVGIAVYPRDGNIARLLECADAAMYRAKMDGKNRYRFFDSEIELASNQLQQLQRDLIHALLSDEFKLYFQPKVDSTTHKLAGIEALLRWQHPDKGLLEPEHFIPAAERFGLMNQIGNWVIEESCRIQHRMRSQSINLNVSINLSSQQFRNSNLVTEVMQILKRYELPASSLMFEIMEPSNLHQEDQFELLLTAFKEAGIEIAIDNFGTGNSSFSFLQKMQVNELKLDRSMIRDIDTNQQKFAIVDSIVRLSHALGLRVIAEGIETEAQRRIMTELRCNQLQGFLFSHPVPEEKLASLVSQFNPIEKDPDESGGTLPVPA